MVFKIFKPYLSAMHKLEVYVVVLMYFDETFTKNYTYVT